MHMTTNSGQSYYISVMGQEQGPYDPMHLRQMMMSGQIRQGETMARSNTEGSQWFPIQQVPGVVSSKQWMVALLLSFFVGGLGIDRFYVGHTGLGIGKLLTLGGCGIWAIVDLVLFAMDNVKDADGLPLRR